MGLTAFLTTAAGAAIGGAVAIAGQLVVSRREFVRDEAAAARQLRREEIDWQRRRKDVRDDLRRSALLEFQEMTHDEMSRIARFILNEKPLIRSGEVDLLENREPSNDQDRQLRLRVAASRVGDQMIWELAERFANQRTAAVLEADDEREAESVREMMRTIEAVDGRVRALLAEL